MWEMMHTGKGIFSWCESRPSATETRVSSAQLKGIFFKRSYPLSIAECTKCTDTRNTGRSGGFSIHNHVVPGSTHVTRYLISSTVKAHSHSPISKTKYFLIFAFSQCIYCIIFPKEPLVRDVTSHSQMEIARCERCLMVRYVYVTFALYLLRRCI